MKNKLIDILNKHGSQGFKFYVKDELLNYVLENTKFLDDDAHITERVFCILNNIKEKPKCKYCNKDVKFFRFSVGYRNFCSNSCASKWKYSKQKENNLPDYNLFKEKLLKKNIILLSSKDEFNISKKLKYKCALTGKEFYWFGTDHQDIKIPWKKFEFSEEKEIIRWLKTLKLNVLENCFNILNNGTIDVFLPEYKIAFEFDSLYWHNKNFCDSCYSINKTLECKEKGIQLIHITENEWNNNLKIFVFNRIFNYKKKIISENLKIDLRFENENDYIGWKSKFFIDPTLNKNNIWNCGYLMLTV